MKYVVNKKKSFILFLYTDFVYVVFKDQQTILKRNICGKEIYVAIWVDSTR